MSTRRYRDSEIKEKALKQSITVTELNASSAKEDGGTEMMVEMMEGEVEGGDRRTRQVKEG